MSTSSTSSEEGFKTPDDHFKVTGGQVEEGTVEGNPGSGFKGTTSSDPFPGLNDIKDWLRIEVKTEDTSSSESKDQN